MNKKAQTGKALTFPIFLLIVIIMGIYLVLAGAITTLKNPPSEQATPLSKTNNIMFKSIPVVVEGKIQDILVLDAMQLRRVEKITDEAIRKGMSNLDQCYHLSFYTNDESKLDRTSGSYKYKGDRKTYSNTKPPRDKLEKTKLLIDKTPLFIEYYQGPCE